MLTFILDVNNYKRKNKDSKKNLDNESTLYKHKKTIEEKAFLKQLYVEFYNSINHRLSDLPDGTVIEIGSGSGFSKKVIKKVLTSDVVESEWIDRNFSAENIPYKNESVSAFFMLNVMHHIKDPQKALQEMQRCLKKGGKIIIIEPYNSFWSKLIYKYIHHEDFNENSDWKIKGKGRLSDANIALPWIIFVRDRNKFNKKFPKLRINYLKPHTPFKYLCSGGLSQYEPVPHAFYPVIQLVEIVLAPLNKYIGMFFTIELEKI